MKVYICCKALANLMRIQKSAFKSFVSLRIQFEYGKIRTRITPNMDTFYVVEDNLITRGDH